MNPLFRPILRSAFRNVPYSLQKPIVRPLLAPTFLRARTVASSVSGRPGSQTFEHAATNIKEEVGNSASDLAKVIAGANITSHSVAPTGTSFLGITGTIASEVPKPVMVFGLAGSLPYLGASATTVYLAHQAGLAATGVVTNIDPGVA
ncbi:hypothetical protein BD779DRAFT_197513 [Infundibulicybe gibba]|nr:hypothetical protein BD779DRAFT_197513 [Infundibulicybe gibba]